MPTARRPGSARRAPRSSSGASGPAGPASSPGARAPWPRRRAASRRPRRSTDHLAVSHQPAEILVLHPQLAALDLERQRIEAARRRPADELALAAEVAVVTGADEAAAVAVPDRHAAKVRAGAGEHRQAALGAEGHPPRLRS